MTVYGVAGGEPGRQHAGVGVDVEAQLVGERVAAGSAEVEARDGAEGRQPHVAVARRPGTVTVAVTSWPEPSDAMWLPTLRKLEPAAASSPSPRLAALPAPQTRLS